METISAVEVWSLPACPRCVEAKNRLRAARLEVVERDLEDVCTAKIREVDILTQMTLQSMAPVIRVLRGNAVRRGEFIDPADLEGWLAANRGDA